MVNSTRYQIWDKHGNSLFGPISFGSLWAGPNTQITPDPGNQCQNDIGDPIVVYDHRPTWNRDSDGPVVVDEFSGGLTCHR
jgi:hypothetical protein